MTKLDKIKERIEKLLNRTVEHGCTKSEAETSFKQARKLMAQYKMSESDINMNDSQNEIVDEVIETVKNTTINAHITWMRCLCKIIEHNFPVMVYYSKISKRVMNPHFFGTKLDVDFAVSIFKHAIEYAIKNSNIYARKYKNLFGTAKDVKPSWLMGFVVGLNQKYQEQNASNKMYELMVITPKKVQDAFEDTFPDIKVQSPPKPKDYLANGYLTGMREGYQFGKMAIPATGINQGV